MNCNSLLGLEQAKFSTQPFVDLLGLFSQLDVTRNSRAEDVQETAKSAREKPGPS